MDYPPRTFYLSPNYNTATTPRHLHPCNSNQHMYNKFVSTLKLFHQRSCVRGYRSTMFGIDRKQMEAERLARLSTKRKRHDTDPSDVSVSVTKVPSPVKRIRLDEENRFRHGAVPGTALGSTATPTSPILPIEGASKTPPQAQTAKPNERAILKFGKPTVLRTHSPWLEHNPGVTFDSLIEKGRLRTAVFSSFVWDIDWLLGKLEMPRTKMVLVMGTRTQQERDERLAQVQQQGLTNVRLCFPPLAPESKGNSIMHSKLMLLFYETHMRILIPTANLVDYDWGEGDGFMENTVFAVDLPRRADGDKAVVDELPLFGKQLSRFLQHMGMRQNVMSGILNFDYTPVKDLGLVYSAYEEATSSSGTYGLPTLHKTVRALNLASDPASVQVDYITGSIGLLNNHLLDPMVVAVSGSANLSIGSPPRRSQADAIRAYFPSDRSVRASLGGPNLAGTICAQRNLYHLPAFEKTVLRDFESNRSGMLSHSKIMFVRGIKVVTEGDGPRPTRSEKHGDAEVPKESNAARKWHSWAYIGSANFTSSAWGSYTKKGFLCRNWECGVVVPGRLMEVKSSAGEVAPLDQEEDTEDEDDSGQTAGSAAVIVSKPSQVTTDNPDPPSLREMFDGIIEIPIAEVDKKYRAGDEPWFFDKYRD